MGFQFVHFGTFSRKPDEGGRTAAFVLDEADRQPDACQHVAAPQPPTVVYGGTLSEVRALHDHRATQAMTEAAGKAKRIRVDQHTLATAVASFPVAWNEVRANPVQAAALTDWERRTVGWLRDQFGAQLLSVVRHDDERYPHLHAYIVPSGPSMRAKVLHPGWSAKSAAVAAAKAEGVDGKEGNARGDTAFKAAMRAWQDSYWEAVGLPCGLARLGPGRRRLTRAEWQTEQAAARTTAELLKRASAAHQTVQDAEADVRIRSNVAAEREAAATAVVQRARQAVAVAKSRVDEARTAARTLLTAAQAEARKTVIAAEAKAKPLRTLGGLLGAAWSGFRGVRDRLEHAADARVKAAETQVRAELRTAKAAARAELNQRFGGQLCDLRRAKEEAERLSRQAEARAAAAEATARSARAEVTTERSARVKAEAERERFRGMWADADNALIAMQRRTGHRLPR